MNLEYDPEKDRSNRAKHGLRLADAVAVFDDPAHVIISSIRPIDGEERFKAVGMIEFRCYTVVYVRRREIHRFISFRRSNSSEIKRYERS